MRSILTLAVAALCMYAAAIGAQDEAAACMGSGGTWDLGDRRVPKGTCVRDTAEKCAARGGSWTRVCFHRALRCVMPTPDAGKPCTDSSQCTQACLDVGRAPGADGLVTGACKKDDDPCGYFPYIVQGKRGATVVAD